MTDKSIEALLEIARAATPGTWKAEGTVYEHMIAELRSIEPGHERGIAQFWEHDNGYKDSRFCATFYPAAVIALLTDLQAANEATKAKHFQIGDPVEVVPTFKYGEWHGEPLWIAEIIQRSSGLEYSVSDRWPIQSHGDITTDFSPDDLVARAPTPNKEQANG